MVLSLHNIILEFFTISFEIFDLSVVVIFILLIIIFLAGYLFWRNLNSRKKILKEKDFYFRLLNSTDNIIDYYKPIRNERNEIIDFEITYSTSRIKDVTGMSPNNIVGKSLSELYPATFENGFFELVKDCVDNDKVLHFENEYDIVGKIKTFWTTAIKEGDGATITSVEVTALRTTTKKLEEVNRELALKNLVLNKAETIARGGSFRFDIHSGVAEFSENFHRVLSLGSGMRTSFSAFKALIHPEDTEKFESFLDELLFVKKENQQIFRLIKEDRTILSILVSGRFLVENGRDSLVGVIQDITKEIEQMAQLEDQNVELKRNNDALDSFTRVVSHDLQEPLRKIQMFISLIKEDAEISIKSRSYFEKTQKAAERMQTLIKHLLSYSRLDNIDKEFCAVNLNDIIEKIIDEHQEMIHKIKAEIIFNELPTVIGIEFQMEQLFDNIISNALKYRKIDEPLKVVISSQLIKRSKIEEDFLKKVPYYYKISILDNGSGFDQELVGKIFNLFQRLHQSEEISGTGLGLAICKKISENHDGYISAVGEENKGATFTIYLPVT